MAAEAEDRTEAATPRRIEKARDEGQVAASREIVSLAALTAGILTAWILFDLSAMTGFFARALAVTRYEGAATWAALGRAILTSVLPVAVASAVAAVLVAVLQSGFLFRVAAVTPDLSRISPLAGIKRTFSLQTLVQLLKSLVKIGVFGGCVWLGVSRVLPDLPQAPLRSTPALLHAILRNVGFLVLLILLAEAAIAGADIYFERFNLSRKLRMSRQEVRDEQKETEGNPQVKGRLRQLARQRARRRMMSAVAKAAVVVTNPTHYAVALAYERGSKAAPRIVAKGADEVAEKIREVARENRVPVVANPPLARALFRLEIDTEIPQEHFKAVAEIIAYVWRMRTKARSGRRRL
jgi:flagellar biosynthetic protein FlhB